MLDEEDASYELAIIIDGWLRDHPKMFKGWDVTAAYPGHLLRYKGNPMFVIMPKQLNKIVTINTQDYGYQVVFEPNFIDIHNPEFFEKLGRILLWP